MPFSIIRNDISKVKADIIVNTANPFVSVGRGVDEAVYNAAGYEELLAERKKIGILPKGEIGVTKAFRLKAKYIVHVSGPVWMNGQHGETECLKNCYRKSLDKAVELNGTSIAFPLLSSGTYGFPKDEALKVAIDVFSSFLLENEMDIYLVVFDKKSTSLSEKLFSDVRQYIDDNYVAEKKAINLCYSANVHPRARLGKSLEASAKMPLSAQLEDAAPSAEISMAEQSDIPFPNAKSFTEYLIQLLNKKNYSNSEVYLNAGISRQYFSKLICGKIVPSKEKLLNLAVGLKLNIDETKDLLACAGYAISRFSKADLIYEYYIEKGKYNLVEISLALDDAGVQLKDA